MQFEHPSVNIAHRMWQMVDVGHVAAVGVSAVRCSAKQRDEQIVIISVWSGRLGTSDRAQKTAARKLSTGELGASFSFVLTQSLQGLATVWTVRGSKPGGGEIFLTSPNQPWSPPSFLYQWRTQEFFSGGVQQIQLRTEDRGQRGRGSGGGSPLVKGSGGSCNLVQEISFHIVKFS